MRTAARLIRASQAPGALTSMRAALSARTGEAGDYLMRTGVSSTVIAALVMIGRREVF